MKENEWIVLSHKYKCMPKAYHCHKEKYCQPYCQKEPQKNHRQGHLVLFLELRGLSVLCLLQEEDEEHLGQGWWEIFEIFYVVLIEPFVKSHHLVHIHVRSVPPVVEYWGGEGLELP